MAVSVSADGLTASLRMAELSADDFDRTGKLAIWKIGKIFQNGRVTPMRDSHAQFLSLKHIMADNGLMFIVLGDYDIREEFYQRTNGWNIQRPLLITTSFLSFGKSSLELMTAIRDETRGDILATLRFRYAYVDKTTRKSKPLPDYFVSSLKKYHKQSPRSDTAHLLQIPPSSFRHDFMVAYSDTDYNKHTNNSEYLKFCMDCATVTSMKKQFRNFKGDICEYMVRSMEVYYWAESLAGQTLTLYVWEDDAETDTLRFHIQKNGRPAFGVKIKFNMRPCSHL